MKKCLVMLLALLVLASVPAAAFADGEIYTEGTMYYTVGDGTITIVGCFGKNEEIVVPNNIGGVPVNTIASGAFVGNKYLKTLYLPDTITNVEGGAIGGGINVVYNYNVQGPINTPPAGEDVEYRPSVEVYVEATPAPVATETPAASGTTGGGTTASGSDVVDDEPSAGSQQASPSANTSTTQTTETQATGDYVSEADVIDEENAPEAPAAQPAAEGEAESAAPAEQQPAEDPGVKQAEEAEQPAQTERSVPMLPILIGVAAVVVIAVIVLAVSKKKK